MKPIKPSSNKLIVPVLLSAIAVPIHASNPFHDDFEGYSADTTLVWDTAAGSGALRTVRDEATAAPFGSPNQYGELAVTSTTS